jgi:hypothetical protein
MLARMLAIGTVLIFIASATPPAWSGDTGGIKGKTTAATGSIVKRNTAPIKGVNAPGNPPPRGGGGHR